MSKMSDIEKGIVRIDDNQPFIVPVKSISYEIVRTSENFKHVLADGEMTEKELLKACGYEAGYVLFGLPHDGKIIYEVRRGIPRLD